ncbi:hypothetical protein B0A58_15875 [Flavobacterium branchiophilum NBRC 15030 = ATCC 35035]|uniref:Uncharacterized protein n=1 Tax=Flavobacterium branchiophilum TaxID=55197 RepID=A0A543G3H1_9FLAO|nr:hypothetical protein [Flavobacterium branchiophilum]OXA66865.1 hypothetical protein B0A58_15875 [Flavobacterium branchiophilum NBRC 15030 = ATCC 35035]TQM40597.1 hypothetical protein BC670_1494 [Flavobacterium branchiophilum]GEM56700.1 hypothetical protein FB1_29210 [Flavobacterium branchiophilum NBRC 15030 = ATCC 35035]
MEIKIIIQQTEDGSKIVYPYNYNKFEYENNKYSFFLKDEGNKAGSANVYTFQNYGDLKAYSLISNEIKDYLGRSGSFFAIRVIIPNQKSIDDIQNLLDKIKDRYMEHYQNKTMTALNFDDLIDAVEDNRINPSNNSIITQGIDKEAFVLWDKTSSLNSYFSHNAASLVKCLYVFEKEKTKSVVYGRMLPFEEVKPLVRKIDIITNGLLESLKVNDIEINKPSTNSFDLITTTDAKVTYKRKDKKEIKVLNGLQNSLILQQEYQAPRPPKTPSNSDSPKATIIAFSLLFVLLAGILGWMYWDYLQSEKIVNSTNTVSSSHIIEDTTDNNIIKFKIIDTISKNEKRYGIVKPDSLSSYEFIYNSGWSYINKKGKNKAVDFSKKSIKEIFESKNIKFNDSINKNFISELEKISGKEILAEIKPKVEVTLGAKKQPEKTQVGSKSQKNSNSSNNTPQAKKVEEIENLDK